VAAERGVLYVVATPIGNLADITYRAVQVLGAVDWILAEDTRRTRILLQHYGISGELHAFHEHNEAELMPGVMERLRAGAAVALVSDAGTPLVSDPGFTLVRAAREQDLPVIPIPGPSAAVCALSAAGLPSDRVLYLGFGPRTGAPRRTWLAGLAEESATLVVYESSHRILGMLEDAVEVLGAGRDAVIARELTKLHETFLCGTLGELQARLQADANQRKGEFVLLVRGKVGAPAGGAVGADQTLRALASELPPKQAARLTARIAGGSPKNWYRRLLELSSRHAD
jgi:16S rRNA (cytidine1402-2'-O)-methyltransferase